MPSTPSSLSWAWDHQADREPSCREGLGPISPQTVLLSALRRWQLLMTPQKGCEPALPSPQSHPRYSVAAGTRDALHKLAASCAGELPEPILTFLENVEITSTSERGDAVHFPTPLREQETAAAIKALEASAVGAIAHLRYGTSSKSKIQVDLDKISAFLMSAYLTTLDGMDKADPRIKDKIPGKPTTPEPPASHPPRHKQLTPSQTQTSTKPSLYSTAACQPTSTAPRPPASTSTSTAPSTPTSRSPCSASPPKTPP